MTSLEQFLASTIPATQAEIAAYRRDNDMLWERAERIHENIERADALAQKHEAQQPSNSGRLT